MLYDEWNNSTTANIFREWSCWGPIASLWQLSFFYESSDSGHSRDLSPVSRSQAYLMQHRRLTGSTRRQESILYSENSCSRASMLTMGELSGLTRIIRLRSFKVRPSLHPHPFPLHFSRRPPLAICIWLMVVHSLTWICSQQSTSVET